MEIHDFAPAPNARKVRAVAYELGLNPTFVTVNLVKGEARSPENLAMNPNAKVPWLVDGDLVLWESNAIISYLAAITPGQKLMPSEPKRRADVERWMYWQAAHQLPALGRLAYERFVKKLFGDTSGPDEKMVGAAQKELATSCEILDKSLTGKEYVAGTLSLADFAIAALFTARELAGVDLAPYANVNAWQLRIEARDSMKRALADASAAVAAAQAR